MAEIEIKQNWLDHEGVLRLVLEGAWKLDYFNIRDGGITDIRLSPRDD